LKFANTLIQTHQTNIELTRERDFERREVAERDGIRERNTRLKEDLRQKNLDNAAVVRERDQARASLNSERQNRDEKELRFREAETKKHESRRHQLEAQIQRLMYQIEEDHDELVAEIQKRKDLEKQVASEAVSASIMLSCCSNSHIFLGSNSEYNILPERTSSKYASIIS